MTDKVKEQINQVPVQQQVKSVSSEFTNKKNISPYSSFYRNQGNEQQLPQQNFNNPNVNQPQYYQQQYTSAVNQQQNLANPPQNIFPIFPQANANPYAQTNDNPYIQQNLNSNFQPQAPSQFSPNYPTQPQNVYNPNATQMPMQAINPNYQQYPPGNFQENQMYSSVRLRLISKFQYICKDNHDLLPGKHRRKVKVVSAVSSVLNVGYFIWFIFKMQSIMTLPMRERLKKSAPYIFIFFFMNLPFSLYIQKEYSKGFNSLFAGMSNDEIKIKLMEYDKKTLRII